MQGSESSSQTLPDNYLDIFKKAVAILVEIRILFQKEWMILIYQILSLFTMDIVIL